MIDRNVMSVVQRLNDMSYRLEVVGDAVTIEAREIRHAASKLPAIDKQLQMQGTMYDDYSAAEATLSKLSEVENAIRHQTEIIRDLSRNI